MSWSFKVSSCPSSDSVVASSPNPQPFPSYLLPSSIYLSGSEAGGHGLIASTPLNTLLSQVLALNLSSPSPILVVGAGGLMDGSDLAHVLSLGAAGGVMGTRFLTTTQSNYPQAKKEMVANARNGRGDGDATTERSVAWDRFAGANWPGLYS